MAFYYKVRVQHRLGALGVLQSTFAITYTGVLALPDSSVLTNMTTWLTRIYNTSGLMNVVANDIVFQSADVTEHTLAGALIRLVGNVNPTINGIATGDTSALTTAMSAVLKTNEPRVMGKKRFPSPVEGALVDGLITNSVMAALAAAAANWMAPGFGASWLSGVFSSKVGTFVPFNGSGTVKNIPGTQVTRKPGRGL